ncbi:hypothetical protein JXQ70_17370 [bacterium]|nr:hypothetical protein [bacterium]
MKETLEIVNQMLEEGLFSRYAIGGGIAALFYIEPITTFDLDIFVLLSETDNVLISLSPIYSWLEKKGYTTKNEQVIIEGVPVQFIPAYNDLIIEAVENSNMQLYSGIKTHVVKAEYLIAIMLQTNRSKDRERIAMMLDQTDLSRDILDDIIEKHDLKHKYDQFRKLLSDE